LKLSSFGKFTVRHKTGIVRFIPFTREVKQTKNKRKIRFTPLGELRRAEPEPESDPVNSKNDPKDSSK
jgi:nucleoid DNA-binding protein